MDIENNIKNIFFDLFNLDHKISIKELNVEKVEAWDSLNHLNLIIAIENKFDINIPPDDFPKLYKDFETLSKYIDIRLK